MRKGIFAYKLVFERAIMANERDIRNMRKIPKEKREGYYGWGWYQNHLLSPDFDSGAWISPGKGIKREEKDGKVIFTISPQGVKELDENFVAIIGDLDDSKIWTYRRIERHAPRVFLDSENFPSSELPKGNSRRRGNLSL